MLILVPCTAGLQYISEKGLSGDDKKAVIDACDDAKVTIGYEMVYSRST